jgi:hypothetical protein
MMNPLTVSGRNLLVEIEAAAHRGGGISVSRTRDAIRDIEIEARKSILDVRAPEAGPIYCTGGCDACRDYARELGVPLIVPAPPNQGGVAR